MQVTPLLDNSKINNDFIQNCLSACGVHNVQQYLNATLKDCDNPFDYLNIEKGVERLRFAIDNNEKIAILVDSDYDGFSSASIIYQFILLANPNQNITAFFHPEKSHGIVQNEEENIVQNCIDNNIKLLICPDSSSNNYKQHIMLHNYNIDCLVLDHHEIESGTSDAIIINHHLGGKDGVELNTALSGAGVTFKFVQACAKTWNIDIGNLFYDLVATSLVTDVCDMRTMENYALVKYGFKHITNPMLKALFENFNTLGNTPIGVSWGLGPKVNAITRLQGIESDKLLFYALVGQGNIEEALKACIEAHKYQTQVVKQIVKEIEPKIDITHNVCVGFIDNDFKSYTGLIANKFTGKYIKPTLILRDLDKKYYSGSLRSPIDIADKINESYLADCSGHKAACGIKIEKNQLNNLIDWFDSQNLNMAKNTPVCSILKPTDITLSLCKLIDNNSLLWSGSDAGGIPYPKFFIEFDCDSNDFVIYAKRTKTVKFNFPHKLSVLKFQAKAEDCELLEGGKCHVQAIVSLSVNEYHGYLSPQAKIEEWEVTPIVKQEANSDWEDLF